MKTFETFKIEIEITCIEDDQSSFDNSIDEAVRHIKTGCIEGFAGNDDEQYSFKTIKLND